MACDFENKLHKPKINFSQVLISSSSLAKLKYMIND